MDERDEGILTSGSPALQVPGQKPTVLLFTLVLWEDWRPSSRRRDYVDDDVIVRDDPLIVEEGPMVRRSVSRRVYH